MAVTPAPAPASARQLPVVARGGSWLPSRWELVGFGIQLLVVLVLIGCMAGAGRGRSRLPEARQEPAGQAVVAAGGASRPATRPRKSP